MNLENLKPNPRNPRKISDKKLEMLKSALHEFGDLSGIVYNVNSKQLVGGHQRIKALPHKSEITITQKYAAPTRTGTMAVGYVEIDGERFGYREVAWDDTKEAAANIAANKHGGEFDIPLLNEFLLELDAANYDLDLTGFDDEELANLMAPIEVLDPQCDEDEVPDVREDPKTKLGDIYQLGRHRLMCGDSTSIDAVEKLMMGKKAEMLFTDPPYGVNYEGGHFHSGDVNIVRKREKLAADDSVDIYTDVAPIIAMFVDGPCYTWFASTKAGKVVESIESVGELSAMLVWHKTNATYGAMNAQYKQRHEPCFYWKPKGSTLRWCGSSTESTLWEVKRDGRNEYHPTQKPVELAERALGNHNAENVLDLFGGSGSTLIAAEKVGRDSFVMELDPRYCDVIVARWEKYTGKKAELLNGAS
jgi:DNA modification methylase